MSTLPGNLRYAMRTLRRNPAFTLVVTATVGIAIGATVTLLGVVRSTIVRPLPFPNAERLVTGSGWELREQAPRGVSYLEAMDWRAMSRTFDGLAAFDQVSLNIADNGHDAARVDAEIVTADFFRVLGVTAARGRVFLEDEHRVPDAHPVAVISDNLWRTRYGSSDDVLGASITLNAQPFTIVGVMPPGFGGASIDSELWIPMMMVSTIRTPTILQSRANRWLNIVARLAPGNSIAEAQRDLDRVAIALSQEHPETNTDRGARTTTLRDYFLGSTRDLVLALFGAAGVLLVIACANVVSLQLVRATSRRREMALRIALGAGRRRLLSQLLTEGIVLAAAGAAVGVLLAIWGVDLLVALAPPGLLPAYARPAIDGWVLACTVLLAIAAGLSFGVAPALARSRVNLVGDLKDGAPSVATGIGSLRRVRGQQAIVMLEVALALVLLSGAGLMLQTLRRQLEVDPGFRTEDVLAARLTLPRATYPDAERIRFASQLEERLRATPGVTHVAIAADLPLRNIESGGFLTVEGSTDEVSYYRHRVSPSYFETLEIALQSGRGFTDADGPESPRVAVVSAHMARRLWPGAEAVGRRFRLSGASRVLPWVEVVGVVDDVRFRDLTSDLYGTLERVDVYFPYAQQPDETIEVAVRGRAGAVALTDAVRRVVRGIDPSVPIYDVAPLGNALDEQLASARFGSVVLSLFGAIAILLAALGIYGLLAFVVGASRREIAIRMALGAAAESVVGRIVRHGMLLVMAGGVIGLLATIPTSRMLTSLLFEARMSDPVILAGVTATLLGVALLACWLPARRASRIAPQAALKSE